MSVTLHTSLDRVFNSFVRSRACTNSCRPLRAACAERAHVDRVGDLGSVLDYAWHQHEFHNPGYTDIYPSFTYSAPQPDGLLDELELVLHAHQHTPSDRSATSSYQGDNASAAIASPGIQGAAQALAAHGARHANHVSRQPPSSSQSPTSVQQLWSTFALASPGTPLSVLSPLLMTVRGVPLPEDVSSSVLGALETSTLSGLHGATAADLAVVLYFLAKHNHSPSGTWADTWCQALLPRVRGAPVSALSMCIWGMARVQYRPSTEVVQQLLWGVEANSFSMSRSNASHMLWGLSHLGFAPPAAWMQRCAEAIRQLPPGRKHDAGHYVTVLDSLLKLDWLPDRDWLAWFAAATQHLLPSLRFRDAVCLTHALGSVAEGLPEPWVHALLDALLGMRRQLRSRPDLVALVASSLAAAGVRPPAAWMGRFVDLAEPLLPAMQPKQRLACAELLAAAPRGTAEAGLAAERVLAAAAAHHAGRAARAPGGVCSGCGGCRPGRRRRRASGDHRCPLRGRSGAGRQAAAGVPAAAARGDHGRRRHAPGSPDRPARAPVRAVGARCRRALRRALAPMLAHAARQAAVLPRAPWLHPGPRLPVRPLPPHLQVHVPHDPQGHLLPVLGAGAAGAPPGPAVAPPAHVPAAPHGPPDAPRGPVLHALGDGALGVCPVPQPAQGAGRQAGGGRAGSRGRRPAAAPAAAECL
jgi:hypothetical protein